MNRYHFNVRINIKDNNAGGKATEDCRTILVARGFKDLEVSFIKAWYLLPLNLVKLFISLAKNFVTVRPGSLIVVQYPLLGINAFFKYYIRLLKSKRCRICCIIHDLDSLRSPQSERLIKGELYKLASYDAVISHNPSMSTWLKSQGYRGHVEDIVLFDYLATATDIKAVAVKNGKGAIAFAGNLGRGSFLKKLVDKKVSIFLNLYGPGLDPQLQHAGDQIKWFGSYSPEEVVGALKGDFGLIWDGDSIDEMSGMMGNYICYNTPHKTSLYLAAGLPVIVSKRAAIAPYVEANGIGFCVESLLEIPEKVANITEEQYNRMKEQAVTLGSKLRLGNFLQDAVQRTEAFLFNSTDQVD